MELWSDFIGLIGAIAPLLAIAILGGLAAALGAALLLSRAQAPEGPYIGTAWSIFVTLAGYSIPIAVLAYVSGYLTVYSRTSAVGNVLPAVLALVGGANIYVFGTDSSKKAIVGYCVVLFSIMILTGTQHGAQNREDDRVARLRDLAAQELRVRTFRENLGLSPEPPAWILATEPK